MADSSIQSSENFIDSYFKEITYENIYQRLYNDVLEKVLVHFNNKNNITDRKNKKERAPETEELISGLKSEIRFLREEIREKMNF